jgi:hypothetical protein
MRATTAKMDSSPQRLEQRPMTPLSIERGIPLHLNGRPRTDARRLTPPDPQVFTGL